MHLQEIPVVNDRANHVKHIVCAHRGFGNDGVEVRAQPVGIIPSIDVGRIFHVVVREKGEQLLDLVDTVSVAFGCELGHTAPGVVGHGAAKLFLGNYFAQHRLDYVRTGDEHQPGPLDHVDEVGHGGRIDGPTSAWTHDGRNLGDDSRGNRIAVEYLAVAGERIDAFLNACAARIAEADVWLARAKREVHHLADFFRMHFAEAAGAGREILRKRENLASIYISETGDDSVSRHIDFIYAEKSPPVFHKHVKFTEGAGIKEIVHTITGGHLPAFKLLGHSFGATHLPDLGFLFSKFFEFVRNYSHVSYSSMSTLK